ncbi:MAG: LysM peptidoglycan-binding domain-containing protein [Xanthomonadales bacterium]|nr:LysM peptidoglycan-binding domain-containing protein [Xanthomonadales bacterium]
MIKKLIHLVLAMFVVGVVAAQEVSLRSDHPDEYVVVRGDTLWDIAGRFLDQPWQWPAIWHVNPQIDNPHLIYPGDRISLVYVDGEPRLVLDRGKPVVRLSPEMQRTPAEPIASIPLGDIQPYLRNVWMAGDSEWENMAYVVANYEQRFAVPERDRTYARGVQGNVGDEFVIVRARNAYYRETGWGQDDERKLRRVALGRFGDKVPSDHREPMVGGELIGYEMWEVARATLVKQGDPAILEINSSRMETSEGDRVMPARDIVYDPYFQPHAMNTVPDGFEVLAVTENRHSVGHYDIVTLNVGANQGVETGHVFSAFRPGVELRDPVKYPSGRWRVFSDEAEVTLPAEYDGQVMVFRVFDEVSFALMMDGRRGIQENDILRHPSEKL